MKTPESSNPLFGRRVVIVLATFDLGGAERQALHLASYLQDVRGAKVAVVALFGGLAPEQPVRRLSIQRRLPCLRVNMPEHTNCVPSFQSIRQFARDLSALQPEFLLPFTTLPNVLCSITWRIAGARACLWNQRDVGLQLCDSRWHRLAARSASHFISNSRDGADYLSKHFGVAAEKIQLIYNGVQLPAPRESRSAIRQNLGLSDSNLIAVMLAHIHRFKDHATVVRAWRIVCDRMPGREPILLLAGRKDDPAPVEHLIASLGLGQQVRLIGPVGDVSGLLHAADFAVFSSISEGTPNGVLEPMLAGLPMVATGLPGCRDALGEKYPHLVAPSDPQSLAAHILSLAEDPSARAALGQSLRARVGREFSVETMCQRTCRLMERSAFATR